MVNGILNVNKPKQQTSFNVVSMVRRLTGEKRVGHAGTLDPEATGILPLCLGQGTRIVPYLMDTEKGYRAVIELGIATDTYDTSGSIVKRGDYSSISKERVEYVLNSFIGTIQQVPPMYSAIKHQGKPLYKLARLGVTVERKSRTVIIHQLRIVDWQPPFITIEVICSKGTYIRSLAHDLGQVLGCGAKLNDLIRFKCGPFNIKNAVSMPEFEDACRYGYWQRYIYPLDYILSNWVTIIVNKENELAIKNGCNIGYSGRCQGTELSTKDYCRAYTVDGRFLGVLDFKHDIGKWHPERVFLS